MAPPHRGDYPGIIFLDKSLENRLLIWIGTQTWESIAVILADKIRRRVKQTTNIINFYLPLLIKKFDYEL